MQTSSFTKSTVEFIFFSGLQDNYIIIENSHTLLWVKLLTEIKCQISLT
jgi:hypothetical protein